LVDAAREAAFFSLRAFLLANAVSLRVAIEFSD
jgi:hypothetical protein